MKTVTVTPAQALAVLESRASSFVSFRTITDCTLFNKGRGEKAMLSVTGINPDAIVKYSSFNALCGTAVDYETLVQNREVRTVEGCTAPTFEAEERKWGTRVNGVRVDHNGKVYVTLHCVAANKPKSLFVHDGAELDVYDSRFDTWRKPAKEEGARQTAVGIEKPVVYRDFALESIIGFTVGQVNYLIQA